MITSPNIEYIKGQLRRNRYRIQIWHLFLYEYVFKIRYKNIIYWRKLKMNRSEVVITQPKRWWKIFNVEKSKNSFKCFF